MGVILGPDGKPAHDGRPDGEELDREARDAYLRDLKAQGKVPILFKGGPLDGRVYTGDLLPQVGAYGCWDLEEERMGGTIIQLVRHTYRMQVVNDQLTWVFDHSEDGPAKPGERPTPRTRAPRPRKNPFRI